ncbi:hypothetical protein L1049_025552 [Liquidambar formosana]|uniref:Sialate O-acetylesterase domain-containing protein n=1 Tax=Liquidambar formosana TaxID=63359 RepID=A0AAP0NET8_LIQFO
MLSLLSMVLLAYACLVRPAQFVYSSTIQWKNIFILAGQSNMSGRGGVVNETWDGIVPPECSPNPEILRLNAELSWEEASEPLHRDIDVGKTCGVGPGMAFANAVLDKDSSLGVVGLVPCAIGGTNISEWARGRHLYDELVRRTAASLQDGGTIRAVLWYQGESDTVNQKDADSYKGKLEKFFSDLRYDLQSPMLPIFQVALASGEGKFIETVRRAQLGITLPNVKCVDAKGLGLKADHLHLTTTAQVQLGLKLAHAFLAS